MLCKFVDRFLSLLNDGRSESVTRWSLVHISVCSHNIRCRNLYAFKLIIYPFCSLFSFLPFLFVLLMSSLTTHRYISAKPNCETTNSKFSTTKTVSSWSSICQWNRCVYESDATTIPICRQYWTTDSIRELFVCGQRWCWRSDCYGRSETVWIPHGKSTERTRLFTL